MHNGMRVRRVEGGGEGSGRKELSIPTNPVVIHTAQNQMLAKVRLRGLNVYACVEKVECGREAGKERGEET